MALGGCSGSAHGGDTSTASSNAATTAVSGQATPFGVMSPGVVAIATAAPDAAIASTAPAVTSPAAAAMSPAVADAPPASAAASAAPAGTTTAPAAAVPAPAVPAPAAPAVAATAATAEPKILSVQTTPAVVHDGDTLLWNVRTTPDVVDVVAHVTVYAFRLAKHGTGAYVLTFTIPHGVPGFFHGTYTLDLVARSASGAQTSTKVPVTFQ